MLSSLVNLSSLLEKIEYVAEALVFIHIVTFKVKWILEHDLRHTIEADCPTQISLIVTIGLSSDLLEHGHSLFKLAESLLNIGLELV